MHRLGRARRSRPHSSSFIAEVEIVAVTVTAAAEQLSDPSAQPFDLGNFTNTIIVVT